MADEGQAAPFDVEAFRTSFMEDIQKTLQGIAKDMKKEIGKIAAAAVTPKLEGSPGTTDDPAPKGNPALPPEVNAELLKRDRELAKLTDSVGKLTQERDTALNTQKEIERVSAIKDAMSGIQFLNDAASKSFFKAVSGDIVRDEEGQLVAKTDKGFLPVDEYIKNTAAELPGLMAPQGRGGSGATAGKLTKNVVTLDDIKPGMTKEQQQAVWQHIQSVGAPTA